MAELPFLPIATDAYLADCDHLTDAEHGRYFLMLMALWRAPRQRLPNDDAWLARKFRRSVEDVQRDLRPLIAEFCNCDGNWITQKRLAKEWAYTTKKRKQRTDAIKSRWNKEKSSYGSDTAPYASRNTPTPTPTPTPTQEESSLHLGSGARASRSPETGGAKAVRLPAGWEPTEALKAWTRDTIAKAASPVSPGGELEKFRDYWAAQPGAKGRKADWDATWRNWIRKAIEGGRSNGQLTIGGQGARPQQRRLTEAENIALFAAGFRGSGGR